MNTKTYTLTYDYQELATVTINQNPETARLIEEMVQFWRNWEDALRAAGGDYTVCWLRKLAWFILRHGSAPKDEEGWFPLDGSLGIFVEHVFPYQFDDDGIKIRDSDRETF